MGGNSSTCNPVSHFLWEASTSSNHSFQVAKQTLNERMHPSFVEVSWSSSFDGLRCSPMLINSLHMILKLLDTSATCHRPSSSDSRNWIFSIFPNYLTLYVILERKSKLKIENY